MSAVRFATRNHYRPVPLAFLRLVCPARTRGAEFNAADSLSASGEEAADRCCGGGGVVVVVATAGGGLW
ncbi:hypothetical protein ACLOAV_008018 [Pseudogymnoascus australis]